MKTTSIVINLAGVATPGGTVSIRNTVGGPLLITVEASFDGAFTASLLWTELTHLLPETVATVSLVASTDVQRGTSPYSKEIVIGVPRSVRLEPGWNLVSWAGATRSGDDVFAELPTAVSRIFAWSDGEWIFAVPANSLFRIEVIEGGQALWIYLDGASPATWEQVRGPLLPTQLSPGWQLVTWTGSTSSLSVAIASTRAEVVAVFAWDPVDAGYRSFITGLDMGGIPREATLQTLQHLDAVWVLVDGVGGQWPTAALQP
jgi:hypothetical protein